MRLSLFAAGLLAALASNAGAAIDPDMSLGQLAAACNARDPGCANFVIAEIKSEAIFTDYCGLPDDNHAAIAAVLQWLGANPQPKALKATAAIDMAAAALWPCTKP